MAVAEREHVTLAARDLNLTQSATSAAVAALESRYATKLFDRVGRRIALTEAGGLFLREAKGVLSRAKAAEQTLIDLADLTRGSLSLAASQTVANYWLPPVMLRYRRLYPSVVLDLVIDNTEGVAQRVRDGAADIGLVEGAVAEAHVNAWPFAEDELILVAPLDHPWALAARRRPDDLRRGLWVMREPGSGARAMLEAALVELGVAPETLDIALELPSNEAVCSAVAGATVVSRLVVACALKAGVLRQVKLDLPRRRFVALRHKDYSITRAQKAFLDLIGAQGLED